jgi:rare lipoprotein A
MCKFFRSLLFATCLSTSLFLSGCGGRKNIRVAKPARVGSHESGVASWYGVPYHGRRAANGEVYDMERLTAAHRTLPFNTWVRVKNLTNDKTVDVRIQDRGPFVDHRIIDLSRAAAREIAMLGPGTAKVRLTVIKPPKHEPVPVLPPEPAPVPERETRPSPFPRPPIPTEVIETELFAVQIGAFQDRTRAETLRLTMEQKYGAARIVLRQGNVPFWRVLVGEKETIEEASALEQQLRDAGTPGIVVRIDEPAAKSDSAQN